MKISIITPVYKGNKYLPSLLQNLEAICKKSVGLQIEWILINDYPNEKLNTPHSSLNELIIKLIVNKENSGIQQSRINGLKIATGEYVIFLDQDDELDELSINKFLKNKGKADLIVGNGYFELPNKEKKKIFNSKYQLKYALKLNTFFYIGNLIISPGMVMIKRESIPKDWQKNVLKINGADDWYLWVLMLLNGAKVKYFIDPIYIHKSTGSNLSYNVGAMVLSMQEALNFLNNDNKKNQHLKQLGQKKINLLLAIHKQHHNVIIEYAKHPIFLSKKVIYKLLGLIH